jgi:3-hydroxyisobutyrate dehydrogenase-like beta-hydroxyacid dehydrogenase
VSKPATVSVVGIGKMGAAIGERILDAGFPLAVYNRTPEKAASLTERGAAALPSPADALRVADACVTMLADDDALAAVVLGPEGVLSGARTGTTLIDMSTVSVAISEKVAGQAAATGVDYLRAPVSGNPGVVASGRLTIIVSGPELVAVGADALLRAIGPTIVYVGEGERARVAKLILAILVGGTAQLLAEALVLGESGGLERVTLLEIISSSAIASPFVAYKTEPLINDDYSATFTTSMMLKDVNLILDLARESRVALPFTQELRTLLEQTADGGYADRDFMALFARLRRLTGAEATIAGAT